MHSNEKPRPGTVGVTAGISPTNSGGESRMIVPQAGRAVNPYLLDLETYAAGRVAFHLERAAWHRDRARRWLAWGHLSPWHAAQFREHCDAATEHERLANLHGRIGASLERAATI